MFMDLTLPPGKRSLKAIAERLEIPYGTVRSWSSAEKWPEQRKAIVQSTQEQCTTEFKRLATKGLSQLERALNVGESLLDDIVEINETGKHILPIMDRLDAWSKYTNTVDKLVQAVERATGEDERKKTRIARNKPSPINNNFGAGSQPAIAIGFGQQFGLPPATANEDLPDEDCDSDCDQLRLEGKNV